MTEPFIKRFDQCPRMDLEALETSQAFRNLRAKAPEHAARLTQFLQNITVRSFRLISAAETMGRFAVHYVRIGEGFDFPAHVHDEAVAFIYIVEGKGRAVFNDQTHQVSAGDCIYLPPGTVHQIFAEEGALAYLTCVSPDFGQGEKVDFRFPGEEKK